MEGFEVEAEGAAGGSGAPPAPPAFGVVELGAARRDALDFVLPVLAGRDNERLAARRRSHAISAYIGANGSGKSMALVHDTLPTLLAGRRVLSTVRLLDWLDPGPCPGISACDDLLGHNLPNGRVHAKAHPLYVPLRSLSQLLDAEHCDVLLDEITGVASSRESQSLPSEIANLLVQLRRRNIALRWSTPAYARADKILREVSTLITVSSGHFPARKQRGEGRAWRDRRLLVWRSFDAAAYESMTTESLTKVNPLFVQRFRVRGSAASVAYDSLDNVLVASSAAEAGACLSCGGYRRRVPCSCPQH